MRLTHRPLTEHPDGLTTNTLTPTRAARWTVAVEGVTRTRTNIRARYRATDTPARVRRNREAIEWQAGQTLAAYHATTILALPLALAIVPPAAYDLLHHPDRGGTGRLAAHYPMVLTGNDREAPRPAHWVNDTKAATGHTRGQHERAAWAIACRAAVAAAGLDWDPHHLLGLHDLPPAIGIDPGAEWTGITACVGGKILEAATIGRAAAPVGVTGFAADLWGLGRLHDALADLLTTYHGEAEQALARAQQTYPRLAEAEAGGEEGERLGA